MAFITNFYINEGDRIQINNFNYEIESLMKVDFQTMKENLKLKFQKNYFFDKIIIQNFIDELNYHATKLNF